MSQEHVRERKLCISAREGGTEGGREEAREGDGERDREISGVDKKKKEKCLQWKALRGVVHL